jgi:hypothetical protein
MNSAQQPVKPYLCAFLLKLLEAFVHIATQSGATQQLVAGHVPEICCLNREKTQTYAG